MQFDKPGADNTDETIRVALEAAKERGIRHIVVAATVGTSARKLMEAARGADVSIVAVTHNKGFTEEGRNDFDPEIGKALEAAGHHVLTATMVTRNINKALSNKFGGYSQTEIVNATLRMFGQGMKVCPEITAMAADAGLIPFDDVIALAGTARGLDTAVVLRANSSNRFFDIKVREILCKPSRF